MTLLINIYGGPSAGKSTIAAGLFSYLNKHFSGAKSVELVTEYAKELTWENRHLTLQKQFYVDGKQFRNLSRVVDAGVDYIVTDSPIMKGSYYAKTYCPEFPKAYHDTLRYFDEVLGPAIHIFLERDGEYQTIGRNEPEEKALEMDRGLRNLLQNEYGSYYSFNAGSPTIYEDILKIITTTNFIMNEDGTVARYPDGTPKTYYPEKPWLNEYGYSHRTSRCSECDEWECDPNGIGHYRG